MGGPDGVSADFVEALSKLELRGNAREVENILWQTLAGKRDNSPLTLIDLPPDIWRQICESEKRGRITEERNNPVSLMSFANLLEGNDWSLARSLEQCERLFLETALFQTNGNRSKTARLLGITARSVYNKVHKHHLC
jgi:DNA-binding NtrC family response regulator